MGSNKRPKKEVIKIYPMPVLATSVMILNVVAFSIFIFIIAFPDFRSQLNVGLVIGFSFFCIFLPFIAFLLTCRRLFSIITISGTGIKRACFKVFWKLEMPWDGINEILYYERIGPYLMISKTQSIQGWSFEKIIKQRDVVQIALTAKVYKAIKPYLQQPIIGLTEEKIKALKLE